MSEVRAAARAARNRREAFIDLPLLVFAPGAGSQRRAPAPWIRFQPLGRVTQVTRNTLLTGLPACRGTPRTRGIGDKHGVQAPLAGISPARVDHGRDCRTDRLAGWAASAATPATTSAGYANAAGSFIITLRPGVDPGTAAGDLARSKGAAVGHVYRHALRGYAARLHLRAPRGGVRRPARRDGRRRPQVRITAQTCRPASTASRRRVARPRRATGAARSTSTSPSSTPASTATHRDLNVVGGVNCSTGNAPTATATATARTSPAPSAPRTTAIGVVGVAPGARLWAVRVLNATAAASGRSIICGIDWVTAHAEHDRGRQHEPRRRRRRRRVVHRRRPAPGHLPLGRRRRHVRRSPPATRPPTPRASSRRRTTRSSPSRRSPTSTASPAGGAADLPPRH